MVAEIARHWWELAIRGALAILFGLIALLMPVAAVAAVAVLFGVFMVLDGIFAIVAGIESRQTVRHWWALLLEGLTGVVAGSLTIAFPLIVAVVLIYFISAWALTTGLMELIAAIRLREQIEGEWRLALSGVLSIVFALLLAFWPASGAIAIGWLMGAYAILFGVVLLALAFHLKGLTEHRVTGPAPA
ncbi:MAG TPA: HdeD family acid-resistance protein [Chloroflexota bacterium]|jgi:uncharacterized membrane protein HdeD (DUF308 family)